MFLLNYFSKKMESLRALPEVESETYFEQEKIAHSLRNKTICDPVSSDLKEMKLNVSVVFLAV